MNIKMQPKVFSLIPIIFIVFMYGCNSKNIENDTGDNYSKESIISTITESLAKEEIPFIFKFHSKGETISGGVNVVSEKDRFLIGSITKMFTATLILELHSKGFLSIDDPVNTYIEEYTFSDDVKIRHLLNHTSGLRDSETNIAYLAYVNPYEKLTLEQVVEESTTFTTNREYVYSNTGFLMLGRIIEIVTGQSYNAYLDKQIIKRLNLTNTCMVGFHEDCSPIKGYVNLKTFEDLDDSKKANLDMGKKYDQLDSYDAFVSVAGSAGALASNADDVETFIDNLKNDYFFDFDLMLEGEGEYRNGIFDYGNGIYGHSAGTVDSSAQLIFSGKQDQFFIFTVGDVHFPAQVAVDIMSTFLK
ncbi:serine hydrolase [Candidatus Haliotispira prima]|uniref:Serine hydrolase n=1 Tax=Candidatus Haliotispira prima TaxID=3034016 RepID=A0ABY8MLN1_9SPIO|nr:serine hydrolase [Candidatus Haliotispira prima]